MHLNLREVTKDDFLVIRNGHPALQIPFYDLPTKEAILSQIFSRCGPFVRLSSTCRALRRITVIMRLEAKCCMFLLLMSQLVSDFKLASRLLSLVSALEMLAFTYVME